MVKTETEFDIYHPDVRNELVEDILPRILLWFEKDTDRHPRQEDVRPQLYYAIIDAGEKLDGYDIAVTLENKFSWPANQHLVALLADAKSIANNIVKKKNGPPSPIGKTYIDKMGYHYYVKREDGAAYIIVCLDSDGTDGTNREFMITIDAFNDHIKDGVLAPVEQD